MRMSRAHGSRTSGSRERIRLTHREHATSVGKVKRLAEHRTRIEQFPPSRAGRIEARARRHNERDDNDLQRAPHRHLMNKRRAQCFG